MPDDNRYTSYLDWLQHPMTRAFFSQLEIDRLGLLSRAEDGAVMCGEDAAFRRQNRLMSAKQTRTIIDRYARAKRYPFSDTPNIDE